ncbi:MAG: hypothetical protein EAZ89_11730, partial [Bacteroidetes bacterium]
SLRSAETNLPGIENAPALPPAPPSAAPRRDLRETAFFFPQLETNAQGEILLNFTIPEGLSRWRFLGLAHTQDLKTGYLSGITETRKDLMVVPNLPRFFREQDRMMLSTKVVNISDQTLTGTARLELGDAVTGNSADVAFGNTTASQTFTLAPGTSTAISWEIVVPRGMQAVTVLMSASAGTYTDAEESTLPVLSDRLLVTESLPLSLRGKKKSQTFNFEKLLASGASSTLTHERLTLEISSNPAWYAVQALPYLMEFPHECTEQIFSRLYANALAGSIANSDPQIQQVFTAWSQLPDSSAFQSQLEKNPQLRNALLQETPWVAQAKDQSERKKRLGLLFDLGRMSSEYAHASEQLLQRQSANGSFSWFPGMRDSYYITRYLALGFGELTKLGVSPVVADTKIQEAMQKAVRWVDGEFQKQYEELKRIKGIKLEENHLGYDQIQYLYMRSFYPKLEISKANGEARDYYMGQARKYWNKQSFYMQGMLAIVFLRSGDAALAREILAGLKESAVLNDELGMYWKNTGGWYWYQAPIESQSLLIQAFAEAGGYEEDVEEMQVWLLQNKRTNDWGSTRATVAACNALLKGGESWLSPSAPLEVTLGSYIPVPDKAAEAGTGYFTSTLDGPQVKPEMGKITVKRSTKNLAWGAVYWQYFEQMDKITYAETPLSLRKEVYLETITSAGPVLKLVEAGTALHPGDKLVVKVEIRVDRDMEYVHLKDLRAAGLEPISVLSTYKYQGGLGYYESTRDAATHFFFDYLPKGTWVLEYPLRVNQRGDFSNGITTLQCMYAPEFTSHSAGGRIRVE